ncbi:hypothetical protein V502_09964, partial [Pseudogymnoascus sp. VKM F-4520 (FW-2644)]
SLALGAKHENSVMSVRKKTCGLTLGLIGFHASLSTSETAASSPLSIWASLESMATLWFGMKVTASESWDVSPPDIYIANENPSPHSQFGGAPVIILCSNASVYRAYARGTRQGTQSGDNGLVHFVSKP